MHVDTFVTNICNEVSYLNVDYANSSLVINSCRGQLECVFLGGVRGGVLLLPLIALSAQNC
jgi:hypothetical protein